MSLIRRAVSRLERRGADPTQPWGDSTPPTNGMLGNGAAGVHVTEQSALQVTAVYGSVGVLADSVSNLPVGLLSSMDPKTRRQLDPSPLLTRPFEEISLTDWLVQFTASLALRGNFYGQIIERDKDFYPTQIKPIHPDKARVRRLSNGRLEYRFEGRPVKIDDVFHVRYLSMPGSLVGLNPIEYLATSLGLARAAELYGASFFKNSALPMGVIEVEEDLDEEETLALAKAWLQMHQGTNMANLPAVLTGGAKFEAISINPRDSQFLESRQYSQGDISGMIFRVPPHMIGLVDRTTSWGTGIEQQEMGFVRNTLTGYLGRFEEAMTGLHPAGQYVRFNLASRLRGDKLQRYQAYSLGVLGGFLCADDIRNDEDMPPLPDGMGQTFLAPANTTTLEGLLQQLLNPPAPPAPDPNLASE